MNVPLSVGVVVHEGLCGRGVLPAEAVEHQHLLGLVLVMLLWHISVIANRAGLHARCAFLNRRALHSHTPDPTIAATLSPHCRTTSQIANCEDSSVSGKAVLAESFVGGAVVFAALLHLRLELIGWVPWRRPSTCIALLCCLSPRATRIRRRTAFVRICMCGGLRPALDIRVRTAIVIACPHAPLA